MNVTRGNDDHEIDIHYIEVSKVKGEDIQVYPVTNTVFVDSENIRELSDSQFRKYMSSELYSEVFLNDNIFGDSVKIYKNLWGKKYTKIELNTIIKSAKEQVLKDFKNPPKHKEKESNPFIEFFNPLIFYGLLFLGIIFLIKARRL